MRYPQSPASPSPTYATSLTGEEAKHLIDKNMSFLLYMNHGIEYQPN